MHKPLSFDSFRACFLPSPDRMLHGLVERMEKWHNHQKNVNPKGQLPVRAQFASDDRDFVQRLVYTHSTRVDFLYPQWRGYLIDSLTLNNVQSIGISLPHLLTAVQHVRVDPHTVL